MAIRIWCQRDNLNTQRQRYLGAHDLVVPEIQALGVLDPVCSRKVDSYRCGEKAGGGEVKEP